MMKFFEWSFDSKECPIWVSVSVALILIFFLVIFIVGWVAFLCEGFWFISMLMFPIAPMIAVGLVYRHKLENDKKDESNER